MAFHKYGQTVKVKRSADVELHVREVTLNADAPEADQIQHVEIREFLREGEVYGHGLIFPRDTSLGIVEALRKIGAA